jgi:hypothetical protein
MGYIRNITKVGNIIYTGSTYMTTINAANPSALAVLDYEYSGSGGSRSVVIDGTNAIAYASASENFRVFDVTNPSAIVFTANYNTSPDARSGHEAALHADGVHIICAGYGSDAVYTVATSDLTTIVGDTGADSDLNGAYALATIQNIAVVSASLADSVVAVDVSNPALLYKTDSVSTTQLNETLDVSILGTNVFAVGRGTSEGFLTAIAIT